MSDMLDRYLSSFPSVWVETRAGGTLATLHTRHNSQGELADQIEREGESLDLKSQ